MERSPHLLIVEDSGRLANTLAEVLRPRVSRISIAPTLASARAVMASDPPSVVLLDVALPDGDSLSLMEDLRAIRPLPHVIAMSGSASPDQSFRLGQAGARAFLTKPLALDALEEVWTRTLAAPPDLEPHLRAQVGGAALHDLEGYVRATLVDEAMARSEGSVRGAARLLGISRQLLQQILRRKE
ncbi:MAG TPA: response regulator [Myxococcaceae bacterium]|nr:response regulator [Myxococcaceae bacterium]